LELSEATLPFFFERTKDVDTSVRSEVYQRLSMEPEILTESNFVDLLDFLQTGFKERELVVRKSFRDLTFRILFPNEEKLLLV
jgi:hypothetical protein